MSFFPSCRFAPDLLQPGVAAASLAVFVIPHGVLLVEVLVVFLGRIERGRGNDLSRDLPLELLLLFEPSFGFLGRPLLSLVFVEDGRPVLRTVVAELSVLLEGIDVVPKDVEQLLVTRLGRVIRNLDGLGVPGPARRDRRGALPRR